MSAHTPGPWEVRPPRPGEVFVEVYAQYGVVCDARTEANARLIAAAPKLLAAAKSALEDLSDFSGDEDYWARVATLRAAIADAEGER